jgi:hypothetical protein
MKSQVSEKRAKSFNRRSQALNRNSDEACIDEMVAGAGLSFCSPGLASGSRRDKSVPWGQTACLLPLLTQRRMDRSSYVHLKFADPRMACLRPMGNGCAVSSTAKNAARPNRSQVQPRGQSHSVWVQLVRASLQPAGVPWWNSPHFLGAGLKEWRARYLRVIRSAGWC